MNSKTKTGCLMCVRERAYKLEELIASDHFPDVIQQAKALLESGYKLENKFCSNCFWE